MLYVNFGIVYYLALIYYQFYGSISVTTFVEVGFFLGGPDHQPRLPQHLVSSFVFHRFSLISFCSRLKVVFLYCNYYFFALCRNLLLRFRNSKNFWWLWVHVLCFGIGPCPFKTLMKLQKIYFLAQFYRIYQIFVFKRNLWGSHCFTLSCGILYTGCIHAELFSKNLNNVVSTSVVTNFYNFWLNSPFKSKHIGKNWLSL